MLTYYCVCCAFFSLNSYYLTHITAFNEFIHRKKLMFLRTLSEVYCLLVCQLNFDGFSVES